MPVFPFFIYLPSSIPVKQDVDLSSWTRLAGAFVDGAGGTVFALTSLAGAPGVPNPIAARQCIIFAGINNAGNLYIGGNDAVGANPPFIIPGGSYGLGAPNGVSFDLSKIQMITEAAKAGAYAWSVLFI